MTKRPSRPSRTPAGNSRHFALSDPAADLLADLKADLKHNPLWPFATTASVLIEYLIWRSENGRAAPLRDFHPETRHGRPTKGLGEHLTNDRPVPPSQIRKLAGVDPVTKQRKLY